MANPNPLMVTRSVEFRAVESAGDGAEGQSDGRTLEGHAAVFNAETEINSPYEGRFTESIAPGAFRKTISERKPVLQFDHGKDARTGSVPIGKIQELREDDHGLYVQAHLFDNATVEPIRQAIEGGAIDGMSFRFAPVRDEWHDGNGKPIRSADLARVLFSGGDGPLPRRTIKEVRLMELGPVVFPAYSQTSVGVRSVSEEDRDALVAGYRKTMIEPEAERAVSPDMAENMPTESGDDEGTGGLDVHVLQDGNCAVCGY